MNKADNIEKIKLREFYAITKWVFSLYLKIAPGHTIINLLFEVYAQLSPLIYALVFANALDKVIAAAQSPSTEFSQAIPSILIMFGYQLLSSVLGRIEVYFSVALRQVSKPEIEKYFYTRLKDLGIQTLEQPEISNKIQRSGQTIPKLYMYINEMTSLAATVIKFFSALMILITALPILAPIMLVAAIPSFFVDKKYRKLVWKFDVETTEEQRKASASLSDISTPSTLQEILITGSFKYLSDKYQTFSKWYRKEFLGIQKRWIILGGILRIMDNTIFFFGIVKLFQNLFLKTITVGNLTFQMQALTQFQSALNNFARKYNQLFEIALQLKDTYELYNATPAFVDGNVELAKLEAGPQITFSNVDFKYPGSDKYIYRNLNLNIKPGEKIAIVGPNGAGKTTLVKLLCRMYEIQAGEILVNDHNINDLKIDSLYKNIGILFQDYNGYPQLTAKENIILGRPLEKVSEEKVIQAAKGAEAHKFITEFKHGYEQLLNERYKEGTRPSTGQWQKLAIARFFYRDAPLVIFDEPTASIDAVSEYNIFNKIYKFFDGKTVIIISHRFSTVRNADRILVVEKGKIIEEGNHTELMAKEGEYSNAFLLQAEGYTN